MATSMRRNVRHPGHPWVSRAARSIAASAKGSAKTVWLNFTKEAHLDRRENIDDGADLPPGYPESQ
jgi:hypothetical protein